MSLILLIVVFISICIVATLYLVKGNTVKASKLSYIFFSSTAVIWTCFLTGVYTLFPDKLASILWDSSWIGLFILGVITFIYEFKNSKSYAFSALIICLINGSFYMFAKIISSM
ncbi:hypothetical protein LZ480_05375 [Solibacillus sp. MA9]|uniref:Uncharacterized protein n=1 Tax=Solibacillus palustris TaxID=2908203 RepID=A0ABS9UAF2_9BACL|nr:hypothetical protein [Solibacillus sp. MA9]MCH7321317.1 hypothetical protein [Solibacillus sp. MA9]